MFLPKEMSETFDDILMALGMIVENFNAVEQTFCEAIAFAIGEDVYTSPRIIKARRHIENLKGLLKSAFEPEVQKAGEIAAFNALMSRFDTLQESRNDVIHSQWIRIENPNQGSGLQVRIAKDGKKTSRNFYASELRKLANDIGDFGGDFWQFLLQISPSVQAAHEEMMIELFEVV
jgi:hypothetical protein